MRILIILSLLLFSQFSFSQFVDTLIVSESFNYSVFGMANYNCKETHADLGCKSDKQTTCFVCFSPRNETDSVLMYKTRIHDSIYVKVYDKNEVLRIEYLQPHAQAIYGQVKVYNKKGELTSLEYYSYGDYLESDSPNHHDVVGHSPFRVGLWKYYNKGVLAKTERYELLHTQDESNYYVLITELIFEKDGNHVKKQNEYISHLEDLEFQHKPLKFKNPMSSVKGANL